MRERGAALATSLAAGTFVVAMLGAPALGSVLAGQALAPLVDFPYRPSAAAGRSFHWAAFVPVAAVIGLIAWWLYRVGRAGLRPAGGSPGPRARFPPWGVAAAAALGVSWVAAWHRFDAVAPFQPHTFTPLWLSFTVLLNALCVARTGQSPLTARPAWFLGLFPASALFWWFFEYLNRFTGNWVYVNVERFSSLEYALFATLAFSTVLPAVVSMAALLGSFVRPAPAAPPSPGGRRGPAATVLLILSLLSLLSLGRWPELLFPLAWIAPGTAVLGFAALAGRSRSFDALRAGDARAWVVFPLAALLCGVFWEMWNYWSLAKWTYAIPLVHRFTIFEMPVLGYGGYLPFGIECLVAAQLLTRGSLLDLVCPPSRYG